jgi:AcrR family transcriptional regulator
MAHPEHEPIAAGVAGAAADPGCKETQILEGAAAIFARDGYEGASMSRIAAEAGVSKGTLYNYFTSKAELFSSYVQRDCARCVASMIDGLEDSAPPERVLPLLGQRMFTMLMSERALVMYRMVIAEAEKFPELAVAFYAAGPAHAVAHVAAYLRRAQSDGWLRVEDPDFAAEQFFALMQTHLCMKRRLRLIEMPSHAEIEHVVAKAVQMFLASYGVRRH